jgi:membrane peptidoglycan carboxypeptidase
MLMDVVKNGTGRRNVGDYFEGKTVPAIAGKTGTTNGCVDAWFVGYTPDLVLAVWVGFNQVRSMGPGMTGSRCAGPLWSGIMEDVLATRDDWTMEFEVPEDIVFRDISSRTGLLLDPAGLHGDEKKIARIPFVKGTEPRAISKGVTEFPYWRYQDPDPARNRIADPKNIPPDLLDQWLEQGGQTPKLTPHALAQAEAAPHFSEEITTEEHFFDVERLLPGDTAGGTNTETVSDLPSELLLPF